MSELKPCPFCNADGKKLQIWRDELDGCVYCSVCGAEGPVGKTYKEIIGKWNHRPNEIKEVSTEEFCRGSAEASYRKWMAEQEVEDE